MIRAALAGLAGDGPTAIRLFESALTELRAVEGVLDEALAAILMASVLEPGAEVRAATERAREILVRLRAQPLLDQLEAALERDPAAPRPTPEASATAGPVSVQTES